MFLRRRGGDLLVASKGGKKQEEEEKKKNITWWNLIVLVLCLTYKEAKFVRDACTVEEDNNRTCRGIALETRRS